jgi:hypothetical protein
MKCLVGLKPDTGQHRTHAVLYGHKPGVACLTMLSRVLWLQGYPD